MTRLRRWIWVFMMAALLLGMLVQAVLPLPKEKLYIEALLDIGHVPLFVVFTVALLSLLLEVGWIARRPRWVAHSLTFVIAVIMGIATEVAQSFVARDADPMDFERDVFGALAALAFVQSWRTGRPRRRWARWSWRILGVAFLVAGTHAPLGVLLDYRARDQAFPVLADVEGGWERACLVAREASFDLVPTPKVWPNHGGRVLRVDYEATEYPALTLREPVSDWSSYDELAFEVFNPLDHGLDLLVRIDDNSHNGAYSDRYNGHHGIGPGANTVVISLDEVKQAPRTRAMNLHAMHSVTFFLEKVGRPVTLYFDDPRLRKSPVRPNPDQR